MPITSLVKYPDGSGLFFITLNSHSAHAPSRTTRNGKIWEKKIYDKYKNILEPNDIAIDVGGYIGSHTLPMSKFCNKVYVFEPNTELHKVIEQNIELNKIDNITLFDIALGNNKDVDFYERTDGTSRIAEKSIRGEKKQITTKSLDSLLKLDSLKLIKIDVEGHEYEVLEGAKKTIAKHRPYILIETFKSRRTKLKEWAKENNYELDWLRGDDFLLSPP